MSQKIVECIPNFSEGRRDDVIQSIGDSISTVDGVVLLDQHTDVDHNRTVFTFAGEPEAVLDAAFAAIKTASQLIDMDKHIGEHPRLGATDVVPFVPLEGLTMEECVELAHQLGRRVGDELAIPVYLYEAAATRPERKNLEDIRRGEYEGLKEIIGVDPLKEPDFGPEKLGKAGATVIGARPPLIAFNVYLSSDDVSIAKKIAKAVRHSSGGLRFVKAIGLLVDGRAQVSMNLTDFRRTPVARVVEFIRREAIRHGTTIHHSELVGLIPQKALVETAQWYAQLDNFSVYQILETRLYSALTSDVKDGQTFLEELAAGTATPGGGSAAAYSGAMGAGLVSMVARLTMGKKKYADIKDRMAVIAKQSDDLRHSLKVAVEQDARAFDAVMEAYRLPKKTDDEKAVREHQIEKATHYAAEVPLQVADHSLQVMRLAVELTETGNTNAITDAGTAGILAAASIRAAGLNVRINADSAKDESAVTTWLSEMHRIEEEANKIENHIKEVLKERGGL